MENNKLNSQRTILLIDGYHLLHKGFYGSIKRNNCVANKNGVMVNAVYTFVAKIYQCIKSKKYHTIIVAFDVGNSCWRKELYQNYKGRRKETPPELIPQMQLVRDFLSYCNIPWYEKETFEGDDVMGTVSRIATKLGYIVEIMSNDKDIYQLVNENCYVVSKVSRNSPDVYIRTQEVMDEFKCHPHQIPDMKSLLGDSSDNLKGVVGLHFNTAQRLLEKYGSVEKTFESIEEIKNEDLKNKLLKNKEKILLNKKIATIQKNIQLGRIDFRPLRVNYFGWNKFLRANGMYSFIRFIRDDINRQREIINKRKEINNVPNNFKQNQNKIIEKKRNLN